MLSYIQHFVKTLSSARLPSERVHRRIDSLLDEAEQAIATNDWDVVLDRVRSVLALEPENSDAVFYRDAAERATGGSTGCS